MGGIKKISTVILLFIVLTIFIGTVAAANVTEMVSVNNTGNESNLFSCDPSISDDGRYIAFSSDATNLVENDNNGNYDVFIRDRYLNITERISVSSTGEEGNGYSGGPHISSNGRYVTFTSFASNLVNNDFNGLADVFVRDRLLNITQRLSISNIGEEGNGDSYEPSISADGCYVAFFSSASNLVDDDANNFCDVFVFDRNKNSIKRISVSDDGVEANSDSYEPSISADGNFIVFSSDATNLVENDNDYSDVFCFDQKLNTIKKISRSLNGGNANECSRNPSISADGRYIAFSSWANNIVEDDPNGEDVFVFDQISGVIERVSIDSSGESEEDNHSPSISGDGRYVTFASGKDTPPVSRAFSSFENKNDVIDIFVYDRLSKTTRKVSVSSTGEEANGNSFSPAISWNGSCIVFSSFANNLDSRYTNNFGSVFVHYAYETQPASAVLYPKIVKSGNQITIRVYNPNSGDVTVSMLDNTFTLDKRADGLWYLEYTVPNLPNGVYDVLVTATDSLGNNQEQINLNFTVDNILPEITATVAPKIVKSGNSIFIDANTSSDAENVTALILGETLELQKQDSGWNLVYYVPKIPEGIYSILLTVIDTARNQNTISLNFTVDDSTFMFSGSLTPETVKTHDNLTITATSDSSVVNVSALIQNQTYNLIKQANGTWIFRYCVPYISDGNYSILLTAVDIAGNTEHFLLNFNVFNPVDDQAPVISGSVTHASLLNGVYTTIPWISFQAFTDPDVVKVTASISYFVYELHRQEDGSWMCHDLSWLKWRGDHMVIFTAMDWSGNEGTQIVWFNVENTISSLTPTISSYKVKSGDNLILKVNVSNNPSEVYFYISDYSEKINLQKQLNGLWFINYTIPYMGNGFKTIYITCEYGRGWLSPSATSRERIYKECSIHFLLDNISPTISSSITTPIKSEDILKIVVVTTPGSLYIPDDTIKVTATIFGNTFLMNLINGWTNYWTYYQCSNWNMETITPNLPDGVYSVLITATDDVGNQNTNIFNVTIDNTPPEITATITPEIVKFIDFSTDRVMEIIAQSSSDTKTVYAIFNDGSQRRLSYWNGKWILDFSIPHIVTIGTYNIILKAIDYAGNEKTTSVSYSVYDNLGSGMGSWSLLEGSTADSSYSEDSSNGSNHSSSGGSLSPLGQPQSISQGASNAFLFFIVMLFLLLAIAGLFLGAIVFGPELAIILIAVTNIISILTIPLDVWDIINYAYNLIFGHVDVISTMLLFLALAGIILEAPVLLIIIGSIILFMFVAIILMLYLGG